MNVLKIMALIKNELRQREIKKSGENKYAKFRYHELADILPHIIELNAKHGVDTSVDINNESATLRVFNVDDHNDFKEVSIPFAQAEMLGKGGSASNVDAIQRMGATITYLRRYLFMTAYDIVEAEVIDKEQTADEEQGIEFKKGLLKLTGKATNETEKRYAIVRRILQKCEAESWETLKVNDPIELVKITEEMIKEELGESGGVNV